jgi:hypothetical protein
MFSPEDVGRTPQQQAIWDRIISGGGNVPMQPAEVDVCSYLNGGGPHQDQIRSIARCSFSGIVPYCGTESLKDRAEPPKEINPLWRDMPA